MNTNTANQSFDVYLEDYSSITAEKCGPNCWQLFWIDELGENRVNYGRKLGSRDDVMLHCESLAEHMRTPADIESAAIKTLNYRNKGE